MKFKTYQFTGAKGTSENKDISYFEEDHIWILANGFKQNAEEEKAGLIAVQKIGKKFKSNEMPSDEAIKKAAEEINPHLFESSPSLICAVYRNGFLKFWNTGSDRLYFFSRDHTDYFHTLDQSNSDFCLYNQRSIFFEQMGKRPERSFPIHESEAGENKILQIYKPVCINPGDAFLLCSSNFWKFIEGEEMKIDLVKSESAEKWGQFMIKRIFSRTAELSNDDDFSLLAVQSSC